MVCHRRLLNRALVLLALAIAPMQASALDKVVLQLRWVHQFQFAGYYAALEKGFYADAGLEVEIRPAEPGRPSPIDEVRNGNAQYGIGNSGLIVAYEEGAPVRALAAIFQRSPNIWLTLEKSAIGDVRDLAKKRLMMTVNPENAELLAIFAKAGINPGQLDIVPSSFDVQSLVEGKADAFNAYSTNEPFLLDQRDVAYRIFDPHDYGIDFYSDVLFTGKAELQQHPERVKAFLQASLSGWQYAIDHPEEIADLIIRKYDPSKRREHLLFEAATIKRLMQPDLIQIGYMNPGRWRQIRDTYVRLGMMNTTRPMGEFLYAPPKPDWRWLQWTALGLVLTLLLLSVGVFTVDRYNRRLKREISEREAAQHALEESKQELVVASQLAKLGYWWWDLKTDTHFWSEEIYRFYGRAPGLPPAAYPEVCQYFTEDSWARLNAAVELCLADGLSYVCDAEVVRPDGSHIFITVRGAADRDESGMITQLHGTVQDITARKQAEDQIKQLAYFDPLTSLPNRRLFMDRMRMAMISSTRSRQFGALLMLDLDHFKDLNDTQGHDMGDRLLVEVSKRLSVTMRQEDTISRLGGDEFVFLVEGLGEEEAAAGLQAEGIAQKVHEALCQPYALAEGRSAYHSTPSIGVTLFLGQDASLDVLLKQADVALYQAKSAGRNAIRFFSPDMQSAIDARSLLEEALRQGILNDEMQLYFQPQVDWQNTLLGAEALLRWLPPDGDPVPPARFIPLAEETGLIIPIGIWVLEQACAQLQRWHADPATRNLTLAINVSARQFHEPDFVQQVISKISQYGINPARLKLELTESAVLARVDEAVERMQALKAVGVGFSLDDFGTGYSSLSYLKRLPLDQVKIDQSFVRDITHDQNDMAIVRAILAMSQSLELNVIAEGVETEAQRTLLLKYGCESYQGFLFGKPVPIDAFPPPSAGMARQALSRE